MDPSATRTPDPLAALKSIEEMYEKSMGSFETRLQAATSSTTLSQLVEDFQEFKVLMRKTVEILRDQIQNLTIITDDMENRSRRKFLLFRGVKEAANENPSTVVLDIAVHKLKCGLQASDVQSCFRLGTKGSSTDRPRPLLVRFSDREARSNVWRAKKELKGSNISVAEFLTPIRKRILTEGRRIFGMNSCWSQDGNIYIKFNSNKHRLLSENHLSQLAAKYLSGKSETEKQSKKTRSARTVRNKH